MRLDRIRVGDLVQVERKGRVFHAEVVANSSAGRGEVAIMPLERGITYRTAAARDVIAHWRRQLPCHPRARSRPRVPIAQPELEPAPS